MMDNDKKSRRSTKKRDDVARGDNGPTGPGKRDNDCIEETQPCEMKSKKVKKRRLEGEGSMVENDVETQRQQEKKAARKKRKKRREGDDQTDETQEITLTTNGAEVISRHSFPTNPLDHCETPFQAYQDLTRFLLAYCKSNDFTPSSLKIWDPYFCDGRVKEHLDRLGFCNVRNENRDFYQRIRDHDLPEYDLLLTNPPYSDDHVEKLLHFCKGQSKPYALLMPNWVARKRDYALVDQPLFYLSPVEAYTYVMPSWVEGRQDHVGEDGKTRPYFSSWYIGGISKLVSEKFHDEMDRVARNQPWVVAKTIKGLKWKIQKKQHR
jgi:hypothetical protein